MANRIVDMTPNSVTFEVDAQSYKAGRFTIPAEVQRQLGLGWNEEVRLRIESLDGQQVLWTGILKMQSGPEIDSADLVAHVRPGERIRVVASHPNQSSRREAIMPSAALLTAPPGDRYVAAFRAVSNITDRHIQMLRVHYHAPERTITAKQLAELVGYNSYSVVNAKYGRLAGLVGQQLDYNPQPERLGTLVRFEKRHDEWHWLMRPEVAEALERLGWVEGVAFLLPEEIAATTAPLVEGAVCRVSVNAYERNPEARRRCVEAHGTSCCICGFSFRAVYGEAAEGYIHVHHLRPLSEIGGEYVVDPVADLRPVCPNCHAVLHRRIPAYSLEEVKGFLVQR